MANKSSIPTLFQELSVWRDKDVFHPDMDSDAIIEQLFPRDFAGFTRSMSDIIGSFYGILLQAAGNLGGVNMPDALSESLMRELGRAKANTLLQQFPELNRDARGILKAIISAIYGASPEYNFQINRYEPDMVKFTMTGDDRYHRISKRLNLSAQLEWPVVTPFFQAVCEVIAPGFTVDTALEELFDSSECRYNISIYRDTNPAVQEKVQTGMRPPFFLLPEAPLSTAGKFLEMELGNAGSFEMENFATLVQMAISGEAWNANRLYPTGNHQYMLGDKFRAFRVGVFEKDTVYKAVVESMVVRKRKRKSIANIFSAKGDLVYQLIFDYFMWSEGEFTRKFSSLRKDATALVNMPAALPHLARIDFTDPYHYLSVISPFEVQHCLGHFEHYPCVPGLSLYRILALEAGRWLAEMELLPLVGKPVVDSLTIHSNMIMPVETPYAVHTRVTRMSAQIIQFESKVVAIDNPGIVYTVIIFDVQL
ncbi:hypothetical protein SAMN05444266_10915 [Chitinophaga jiangningensis]|uniref:Uncharacterized protein n=1 Tax=Chitinophaga jiangningensis TaxID=1419482 RepID=A0A1M7JTE7_9BACT|nr:hypothetical protein [Chitinophaga jiangningensis]SHM56286.1 hypothetical protein SAMN05444266_10915 [Chitinophaga jiangningensis]